MSNEFIDFVRKTLNEELGTSGEGILSMVLSVKPIDDKSSPDEISDFISTVEYGALAAEGQDRATEIGLLLRNKAQEMKKMPVLEKIEGMNAEINDFLKKHDLPTEQHVMDYAKYLTMKYGGSAQKIEKELIDSVKVHVKEAMGRNRINEEIIKFLTSFPEPSKDDVNEFIKFLHMLKLNFQEEELSDRVEKIRLFRKFNAIQEPGAVENPQVGEFINIIRSGDKDTISKAMQKQGLSYLVKDDSGMSGNELAEFIKLATPNESDMKDNLEGMGLQHLIKKKA